MFDDKNITERVEDTDARRGCRGWKKWGRGESPSGRGSRLRRQECPVFPLFPLSAVRRMEESDISKRDSPAVPVGNGYGGACGGMGCSLPDVVGEEHQAVGDVHVAHTAVEVERKQVHLRVEGFYPFLDPFGYDVVGDAAERL